MTDAEKKKLLAWARTFLRTFGEAPDLDTEAFRTPGASFVALLEPDGNVLRSMGSVLAREMLGEGLRRNLRVAAFADPFRPPLGIDELEELTLRIDLVSPLVRLTDWGAFRPAAHGIALCLPERAIAFLPGVCATPEEARRRLCERAALTVDDNADYRFFTTETLQEENVC